MAFWKRIFKWLSYRRLIEPIRIKSVIDTIEVKGQVGSNSKPLKPISVNDETVIITEENEERVYINIQNIGIYPCLIALGDYASLETFNFILAGDTDIRQGNGGSLELKEWQGLITAACENGATTLVVTELCR